MIFESLGNKTVEADISFALRYLKFPHQLPLLSLSRCVYRAISGQFSKRATETFMLALTAC